MNKKIVFGIAAGAIAIAIYYGNKIRKAVEQLQLSTVGYAPDPSQTNAQQVGLKLKIQAINPTDTTLSFDRIKGSLKLNGTALVNLDYNGQGKGIKFAPGTSFINVPVQIQFASLVSNSAYVLVSLATGGNVGKLIFEGYIYISGVPVPISTVFDANSMITNNTGLNGGVYGLANY